MAKVLNRHKDDIPEDAIYVGRPSKWGNPFVVGIDGNREECLDMYMEWLLCRPHLLSEFHELKGHDLVCWCAPQACHADILLKLADASKEEVFEPIPSIEHNLQDLEIRIHCDSDGNNVKTVHHADCVLYPSHPEPCMRRCNG